MLVTTPALAPDVPKPVLTVEEGRRLYELVQ